ncbi:DUF742 domain-containing protein [Nocardia camponoti]|uniref:DUF742 domain-containing protein n=1 Tax=Nocardia camponoti TaxID=1616106 RepID=A0A917QCU9_9NOCA|nr:DUF742 domain-containing protein [Nocardia camponoti]GGK44524.1 hypothetical protein GCM10011591_15120 [Nocardia camponoti]
MTRAIRDEDPDRFYTITGGRAPIAEDFDLVTLIVAESAPVHGMPSEHIAILDMCRAPTAVVEIAAELRLPVGVTTVLLSDLLHAGKITLRPPLSAALSLDASTLKKVLVGLSRL